MPYWASGCRYCKEDPPCDCNCHTATQEDQEEGFGGCDPEVHD